MIQMNVFCSILFKPLVNDEMGWLVEFRPMEITRTPDKNVIILLAINLLVLLFDENEKINW